MLESLHFLQTSSLKCCCRIFGDAPFLKYYVCGRRGDHHTQMGKSCSHRRRQRLSERTSLQHTFFSWCPRPEFCAWGVEAWSKRCVVDVVRRYAPTELYCSRDASHLRVLASTWWLQTWMAIQHYVTVGPVLRRSRKYQKKTICATVHCSQL